MYTYNSDLQLGSLAVQLKGLAAGLIHACHSILIKRAGHEPADQRGAARARPCHNHAKRVWVYASDREGLGTALCRGLHKPRRVNIVAFQRLHAGLVLAFNGWWVGGVGGVGGIAGKVQRRQFVRQG